MSHRQEKNNEKWKAIINQLHPNEKFKYSKNIPKVTKFKCSDRFYLSEKSDYNDTCVPKCNIDVLFRQEDKDFAEIWMIVWAIPKKYINKNTMIHHVFSNPSWIRYSVPSRPLSHEIAFGPIIARIIKAIE
jgi:hypothetical protein